MLERVFGDLANATLSSHLLFLERASRETAEGRKAAGDLALGTYIVARLIETLLELDDAPEHRDGFRWQRDVALNYIRQLPEDKPETNHLAGIVRSVPTDGGRASVLTVGLTAYAYFLEYEGRLEEALDMLALTARAHGPNLAAADLGGYALLGGKLNRLLARWDRALACYSAAEEIGAAVGDEAMMLRGRLHQGAVARGQGNLPRARAIAEEIAKEATARGLAQVQCMAYADLANAYNLMDLPLEAIGARYAAFLVATSETDRLQALGDLGYSLAQIQAYEQARLALQIVANARTDFRIRTNAAIELMDVESATGNRMAFERHRAATETARDRMPPSMVVDYHYKVGVGLARFSQVERANEYLAHALAAAERHALHEWYFRVERTMKRLASGEAVERAQAPAELREAPVIRAVELGLREYSEVAPA